MKLEKKFKQEVEHIQLQKDLTTKRSFKKSLIVNKSILRSVQLVNNI